MSIDDYTLDVISFGTDIQNQANHLQPRMRGDN